MLMSSHICMSFLLPQGKQTWWRWLKAVKTQETSPSRPRVIFTWGQFPRATGLYRQIENSCTFLCEVRYDQPTRVQNYTSSQSKNQSIHPLVCSPAVLYRVREGPQDCVMHIPHPPTLLPLFLCMLCIFIQVHAHIVCIHVCICICVYVCVVANGLICTWVFEAAWSTEHGDWLVWLANEFHQSARLFTTILLLG